MRQLAEELWFVFLLFSVGVFLLIFFGFLLFSLVSLVFRDVFFWSC